MTSLIGHDSIPALNNPLDLVEQLLSEQDWSYERNGEDEVSASVPGNWAEYHLRFFWREEDGLLHAAAAFDMRVPEAKRPAIYETLARINERMWIGHFETWADDGTIMFRHAAFLDPEAASISHEHAELLIQSAINECDRFYPVFQFVLWAGKKPSEAIEAAMLVTAGEA